MKTAISPNLGVEAASQSQATREFNLGVLQT